MHAGRAAFAFTRRPVAKGSLQASPRSPGSRAWSFQTCMGSKTTQGRPAPRAVAAGRMAFRGGYSVGALIANFRSSIPSPSFPLFTLRWTLRSAQRKTRGRADRYSFLVRLFHSSTPCRFKSRRTTTFFSRHGFRSWLSKRMRMVSLPTRGTSLRFTASSATNRTVQRARPSGG